VCDLETSKEEAKSPLKGCEYKPTMVCYAERERERERPAISILLVTVIIYYNLFQN
jgi:hypothetical protein